MIDHNFHGSLVLLNSICDFYTCSISTLIPMGFMISNHVWYLKSLDVWDITFAKNQQNADGLSARRRYVQIQCYVIIPWYEIFSDDRKVHVLIQFTDNCPHTELSKN